jgi:tetratricopeptide (TPR) repeat protein
MRTSIPLVTAARICRIPLWFICLLATATAQRGGLNDPRPLEDFSVAYETAPGTGVLIFSVFAERSGAHLDRQALLKLVNVTSQTATWQTTEETSQGVFTNVPYGSYEVEVSAVGYLSDRKELRVIESLRPAQIDVVLHRDPAAINFDAVGAMSPRARKETKRAVFALRSQNLKDAQKHLDAAYGMAPSSADVNFLLGYLYFQKKDFAKAESYLSAAANLNPHNAQTLTLLGRTGLEREDYAAARSALEQAVMADQENWLPHNLLADTYLHENSYDKARDEAQVAISKGKGDASPAQLVLGQALLGLGHKQEGIQALNSFLHEAPHHPMSGQVRNLIAQIEDRTAVASAPDNSQPTAATVSGIDPLLALSAPGLTLKSWKPPGLDDVKLSLAPGVECPSERVLEGSGQRVQEFVEDVARFAAVEDLFHQALDQFGIPIHTEIRKYNYVASISEPQPGFLAVDEFREEKLTVAGYPDQISATGLAALALVFHPHMRDNFTISCEGLGDWHGQATWLMHFRQREDRPNHMQSYKVGSQLHFVKLKGRAWITADKFQIVRIEAEMVNPMPEIQLLSEHQVVEYGPIPFEKKNTSLWLPRTAEIYFDFRKHRYYRRHSFDHYMLYSVDSEEKRQEPTAKPASKGE